MFYWRWRVQQIFVADDNVPAGCIILYYTLTMLSGLVISCMCHAYHRVSSLLRRRGFGMTAACSTVHRHIRTVWTFPASPSDFYAACKNYQCSHWLILIATGLPSVTARRQQSQQTSRICWLGSVSMFVDRHATAGDHDMMRSQLMKQAHVCNICPSLCQTVIGFAAVAVAVDLCNNQDSKNEWIYVIAAL